MRDQQRALQTDEEVFALPSDIIKFAQAVAAGEVDPTDLSSWAAENLDNEAPAQRKRVDVRNTPDPREGARKAGKDVIERGGKREDGLAAVFSTLTAAGAAGDPRVILDDGGIARP